MKKQTIGIIIAVLLLLYFVCMPTSVVTTKTPEQFMPYATVPATVPRDTDLSLSFKYYQHSTPPFTYPNSNTPNQNDWTCMSRNCDFPLAGKSCIEGFRIEPFDAPKNGSNTPKCRGAPTIKIPPVSITGTGDLYSPPIPPMIAGDWRSTCVKLIKDPDSPGGVRLYDPTTPVPQLVVQNGIGSIVSMPEPTEYYHSDITSRAAVGTDVSADRVSTISASMGKTVQSISMPGGIKPANIPQYPSSTASPNGASNITNANGAIAPIPTTSNKSQDIQTSVDYRRGNFDTGTDLQYRLHQLPADQATTTPSADIPMPGDPKHMYPGALNRTPLSTSGSPYSVTPPYFTTYNDRGLISDNIISANGFGLSEQPSPIQSPLGMETWNRSRETPMRYDYSMQQVQQNTRQEMTQYFMDALRNVLGGLRGNTCNANNAPSAPSANGNSVKPARNITQIPNKDYGEKIIKPPNQRNSAVDKYTGSYGAYNNGGYGMDHGTMDEVPKDSGYRDTKTRMSVAVPPAKSALGATLSAADYFKNMYCGCKTTRECVPRAIDSRTYDNMNKLPYVGSNYENYIQFIPPLNLELSTATTGILDKKTDAYELNYYVRPNLVTGDEESQIGDEYNKYMERKAYDSLSDDPVLYHQRDYGEFDIGQFTPMPTFNNTQPSNAGAQQYT